MPKINVRFFGPALDLVGKSSLTMEIEEGATVGVVAERLSETYPRLGEALGVLLAVNRSYVPMDHVLSDGDEIAVIPPVSGGAPKPLASLTREPIDVNAVVDDVRTEAAGAVVVFSGTVRAEEREGSALQALEYHAYEEMAADQIEAVRRRALATFEIVEAAIVHRLGRLSLGETSILIVVASAHREAAFDACRWIIDTVKTEVPIWKKDHWADGSQDWVDPLK